MTNRIIYLIACCLLLAACEEKIEVDLNSAAPRIVIEGNVTNDGQPAYVLVSQTTSFNDTVFFKGLKDAVITITGPNGTDTLKDAGIIDGAYASFTTQTVVGATYRLKVEVNGQVFESVSEARPTVPIDSVYVTVGGFDNDERVTMDYHDIPGPGNYYKADIWVNGRPRSTIDIEDDYFTDGLKGNVNFGGAGDIKSGDTVDIYFKGIDKNVYQYFYTLDVNTSGQSAAPANPVSNISNGALGYFNAATVSHRRYIYP